MAGDFKNLDADLNCHEPQNPKHKPSRMILSSTVTNRPSGERLFSLPISRDGGRLQKLGCLSNRYGTLSTARPHIPGISILASRSAPLYTKRPSAWAGCVRGSCFQLPTPSAAFTLRSHMPEATGCQGISCVSGTSNRIGSSTFYNFSNGTSGTANRIGSTTFSNFNNNDGNVT